MWWLQVLVHVQSKCARMTQVCNCPQWLRIVSLRALPMKLNWSHSDRYTTYFLFNGLYGAACAALSLWFWTSKKFWLYYENWVRSHLHRFHAWTCDMHAWTCNGFKHCVRYARANSTLFGCVACITKYSYIKIHSENFKSLKWTQVTTYSIF